MVKPIAAPATATLRISDGRQGKVEALVVRSRAFQVIAEEARAAPDVVTSMYLFLIPLFMFPSMYLFLRVAPCEWYLCSGFV